MKLVNKVVEDDGEKKETILTFEVSAEEVDEQINDFFKKTSEQNEIPGFRKGKAPRSVLEKVGGGHEAAFGKITEELVNTLGFAAIDDANVLFVTDPEFNVSEKLEEHKPFTFTVSGQTEPIVKLTSVDPVTINMPPEEATETEIDDHIQNLREYYYTFKTVKRKAKMGDYVMVSMTCSTDGHDIIGLTDVDRLVGLGEGTMPDEFDKFLVGTKKGDVLDFSFAVGPDDQVQFKTDEGTVHVNGVVKEVREKQLPELNDEFAIKVGSADVNDLRKAVKEIINRSKSEQLPQIMEDRCIEAVAERMTEEIPEYYIEFMRNNILADYFSKLQEDGVDLQEYILQQNLQSEQIKEGATEQAKIVARRNIALDSLFEQLGMELTEEDIDREFASSDDPEAMRKDWEESNNMALFRQACRRNKVTNWLIKTAEVNVVEEKISSDIS